VRVEPREATRGTGHLSNEAGAAALVRCAAFGRERRVEILAANRADVEDASGRLDEGTVDRLRLDDGRVEALGEQIGVTRSLIDAIPIHLLYGMVGFVSLTCALLLTLGAIAYRNFHE